MGRRILSMCGALSLMLVGIGTVYGAEDHQPEELLEMPMQQLMDVSVISAARKTQTLSEVASAVFVIDEEDIRRSGATTIPDLLRMVPGVQVSTVDGTTWAVSIRGFNGNFANKLLVMIDGRSVYTPLYGGVFWDVQDVVLEDIERIEVIRGPGSTMWGANAVNGVINIITKSAHDTRGSLVTGLTGSRERGTVEARFGSGIGDTTSYRLYAKYVDRAGTPTTTGQSVADAMTMTRGGFRVDRTPASGPSLTVQGDVYGGTADHTFTVPTATPPTRPIPTDLFGANLLTRLDWLRSESSKFSLQLYYDRTDRDSALVNEGRDTFDINLQHNVRFASIHELTWGAGYRLLHDHTPGTGVFFLTPLSRTDTLLNLFVQDEINVIPEKLRLIFGSKVEYLDVTGWEVEPSAKLSWTPVRGYSLWASVARAVRTPTRGEQDATIALSFTPAVPPNRPAVLVEAVGNRDLDAESVLAYELGVRGEFGELISLDVAAFYNQYHDLMGFRTGNPIPGPTVKIVPQQFANVNGFDSTGVEVALQCRLADWWKIKGGYSYIEFFGAGVENSLAVKATPRDQATLRSMWSLGRDVDLDAWLRYADASRYVTSFVPSGVDIPSYVTADLRLAWRPTAGVELSVVGQNLVAGKHLEAVSDQSGIRHDVPRSVYGKVAWAF